MEKSKLMMIIIIVLLVVLLATVAGVAFYVLNLIKTQNQAVDSGEVGYTVTKELPLEDTTMVSLGGEITTNLADSVVTDPSGREVTEEHSVRVNASFRYDKTVKKESEAFAALLAEEGVIQIARSIAVDCLNSVTYEEVKTPDGKAMLAETLKASLQEEFDNPLIVAVYFSDWVLV